jgi:hypothetical protein
MLRETLKRLHSNTILPVGKVLALEFPENGVKGALGGNLPKITFNINGVITLLVFTIKTNPSTHSMSAISAGMPPLITSAY